MTFTSSDLVNVVVLHEINQNDVQGQDTWTVNENTFYGLSLIKTHHLFSNIFSLPCSGPLTSEPAIG